MTIRSTSLHIGDSVRDRANLGGTIVDLSPDEARVHWNNGYDAWIKIKHLTLDNDAGKQCAECDCANPPVGCNWIAVHGESAPRTSKPNGD